MKTIYLCGPTLYSDIHIGNARSLVIFDVIAEYHRRIGGVKYARNITDFDDKILAKSENPAKWVKENTLPRFRAAEQALGLKAPDVEPFASDYLEQMTALVRQCIQTGNTTTTEDGVYLTPSSENYGRLSNRTTQTPFAIWKFSDGWGVDAEWGFGRPGWHTECAAMIMDIFGTVDLHGGGNDLKFPHHANENEHCNCVHGHDISAEWMYVGTVTTDGRKMAKSTGNVVTVLDLAKDWAPATIRTALLMAKYSKPIEFTVERLQEAERMKIESAFLTDTEWNEKQFNALANNYTTRL